MFVKFFQIAALLFPAATLLAHSSDRATDLLRRLASEDAIARQAAANDLGRLGDARAVEPLTTALRDKDWGVRREAAQALAKFGKSGIPPLIAALKDDDWVVRQEAAKALGTCGPPAVEPLLAALRDPDWRMRSGAASALGRIKDARAVEPLLVALKDTDQLVHLAAAQALGDIAEPAVAPLISTLKDPDWRIVCSAVEALSKVGKPAVQPLIAAAQDASLPNRWAAAWALEIIGTPEAKKAVDAFLDGRSLADITQNYSFLIKRGQTYDEFLLILALERFGHPTGYGYPRMAQDFMNSGNPLLREAGRRWAVRYKYEILNQFGPAGGPQWRER